MCLDEAAGAFRAGEAVVAAELAGRAGRAWKQLERPWGVLLSRSLSLCCGAAPEAPGEVEALSERTLMCPIPGVGAQALGLLGRAFPEAPARWREQGKRLIEGISRERREPWMDVLSMAEASAWALGGAAGGRGHAARRVLSEAPLSC